MMLLKGGLIREKIVHIDSDRDRKLKRAMCPEDQEFAAKLGQFALGQPLDE